MKTIVGSFDSFDEANRVARELMDDGFRDSDVSVVASNVRNDYRSGTGTSSGAGVSAPADTSTGVAGTESMLGARGTRTSTGFTNDTGAGTMAGMGTASGGTAARGTTSSEHYTRSAADNAVSEDGAGLTDAAIDRHRGVDDRVDDGSNAAAGAVTGGVVGGAAGLAASLMGLAIPGIGPIIAAGPIVSLLTGAGVGAVAGGLIGGLTDMGVSRPDAEYYAEAVRRGGALVTVRADDARADRAAEIMRSHGAIDIERRAEQWRERGWTGFDEKAQPYTPADLDRDRDLYGRRDRETGIASGASIGGVLTGGPAGSIPDRDTAGSAGDRTTPRTPGAGT
ncbi:MAG TPA: hypothetical protein VFO53_03950 [Casimicrobiaceae bacterium]|nr:hypothetical protein [Casimicrobiaceae bacterium]